MPNGDGGLNTLEYARKLEHVGMPREQAEVQASVLYEVISSNLATKTDVAKINENIAKLETNITNKMVTIVGVMVGVGVGFLGLDMIVLKFWSLKP